MDTHLNVFRPYSRPAWHEDQLTRAAMIVMRAVPLARDAFLDRLEVEPSARLPPVEVDMQTRQVLATDGIGVEDAPWLHRLVSVFLSPDEGLDFSRVTIGEREGGQRLDGVLRFGDELVVVIESKVVGEAPTTQARELGMAEIEVEDATIVHLAWHNLLADWWGLLERGLLAPAEQTLLDDLVALVEEHFAHLLPFTTLARAGQHPLRRQRRLMALLRAATGLGDARSRTADGSVGAEVLLDDAIGTVSTQRIALEHRDDTLQLGTWPAELKPQAEAFYASRRAQQLIELASTGVWEAHPNPHLAYRGARTVQQRLHPTCRLELAEYIRRWAEEDLDQVRAHPHDEVRDRLWPWLEERGYADPSDRELLDGFLDMLGRRHAHLRPGVLVRRRWPWDDAVELDEAGELVNEVATAIRELLTALNEPLPPALE